MHNRRQMLQRSAAVAATLGGLGLLPQAAQASWNTAAFAAHSLADVVKALGGSAPVESKDVALTAVEIAENGAVVPVTVSSALPGVKRLLLVVEKNPNALAAIFDVSDAIDANFRTNIKMAQTATVTAVAITADGKVLFTDKEVKVTLGGCGG